MISNFRKKRCLSPRIRDLQWCQKRDLNSRPPAYEARVCTSIFWAEVYLKLLKYSFKVEEKTTNKDKKRQKTTKTAKCGIFYLNTCNPNYYKFTTFIAELLPSKFQTIIFILLKIYLCECLIKTIYTQSKIHVLIFNPILESGTHLSRFSTKFYGGVE